MRLYSHRALLLSAATLPITLAIASTASASGYWNVPSTFCQCFGFGWGAGYHAPLVLGPITCDRWCDHNEVRLPYAPVPSYTCYGPSSDGCCDFNDASRVAKPVAFSVRPAPRVPPAADSIALPIFDAPVEP